MTAMAHEPLTHGDVVLEGFLALGTPEGFRAELIEGEIAVTPPPDGEHEDYINLIVGQVYRRSVTEMDFPGNKGLKLTGGGACPRNHAIPDATFAPASLRLFRGADPWTPCDGVAMVVEVTSSRAAVDRESKRRCHARGGIPVHLLVDRDSSSLTLFSDPGGDDYLQARKGPFGNPMPLPEPFSFDLDTAAFL
ncbi:Uma2 family endonuclease [Streptomyces sp. MJP52]|nr:Uma2 family endonuclease [Streptomyces sp. MJP52]